MYNQNILNDNDMVTLNVDAYFPKNLTTSYDDLEDKPSINGVVLEGNKTTEELRIDQNFVKDNNYVHTDNNYTSDEKTKLSTLENYDDTEVRNELDDTDKRVTKIENYMPQVQSSLGQLTNTTNQAMSLATGNQSNITALQNDNKIIHESIKDIENAGFQTANDVQIALNNSGFVKGDYVTEQIDNIPKASTDTLGLIKVGENLSIDENGTLNATGGGSSDDRRLEFLRQLDKISGIIDISSLEPGLYAIDTTNKSNINLSVKALESTLGFNSSNISTGIPVYLVIFNRIDTYNFLQGIRTVVGEVIISLRFNCFEVWRIDGIGTSSIPTFQKKIIHYADTLLTNGDNTINGLFSFNQLPISSITPTEDNQLVTKKYVDEHAVSSDSNDSDSKIKDVVYINSQNHSIAIGENIEFYQNGNEYTADITSPTYMNKRLRILFSGSQEYTGYIKFNFNNPSKKYKIVTNVNDSSGTKTEEISENGIIVKNYDVNSNADVYITIQANEGTTDGDVATLTISYGDAPLYELDVNNAIDEKLNTIVPVSHVPFMIQQGNFVKLPEPEEMKYESYASQGQFENSMNINLESMTQEQTQKIYIKYDTTQINDGNLIIYIEDSSINSQTALLSMNSAGTGMVTADLTPSQIIIIVHKRDIQESMTESKVQISISDRSQSNILFKDNTEQYTPTQLYHPATKEYVDQAIQNALMNS